ncbi:MAG: NAD(P)-dependent alcohol dehydrogenase [Okeania sp. SIO2C9]|nr:NAD(P)-dependent alcohol dehydrogenase [Okeania sp. SIO2C9]
MQRLWFGVAGPKQPILGTELSGIVSDTGKGVTTLKKGDRVFAFPGVSMGANADYICLPESQATHMPANMTFIEAAGVLQGGLTAFEFLKQAEIQKGQSLLVLGASGGVGIYAVQIAKKLFSAEVTGVCSTEKISFVKHLGADTVIDYTKENIMDSSEKFDIIFDTYAVSSFRSHRLLKPGGTYLFATFGLKQIAHILMLKLFSSYKALSPLVKETNEDLVNLKNLIELGVIKTYTDRTYPLEQAGEAHQYMESGHKKGNIILTHH